MSVRSYTWHPRADRRRQPGTVTRALPWLLVVATVLAQIAYPLVHGDARDTLTVVTVVLFFLASVTHAVVWRGLAWAAGFVVVSVGVGLGVEALGVATDVPFGAYSYADSLGPTVAGVPWVIPLAWSMMAYPALLVGRRLTYGRWVTPLVAGLALATWDLFLDPQMVAEGHWTFAHPTPSVPLSDGVPLTNFAGWLLVAVLLMIVLDRLPRRDADDGPPAVLYLWTYVSSIVASALFFDRPGVALVGGVGMGLVALPYAWSLWSERA